MSIPICKAYIEANSSFFFIVNKDAFLSLFVNLQMRQDVRKLEKNKIDTGKKV